jgi:hypothetical protein
MFQGAFNWVRCAHNEGVQAPRDAAQTNKKRTTRPGMISILRFTLHRLAEKKKARVKIHPGGIRERSKRNLSRPA